MEMMVTLLGLIALGPSYLVGTFLPAKCNPPCPLCLNNVLLLQCLTVIIAIYPHMDKISNAQ